MPASLRSTGVTPLQSYDGRLRLPVRAGLRGYFFPLNPWPPVLFPAPSRCRVSQVPGVPFADAPPSFSPGGPAIACDQSLHSRYWLRDLWDRGHPQLVFRGRFRFACAAARRARLPRLQTAGCPAACSVSFMFDDQFTWRSPFISQGSTKLRLAHQRHKGGKATTPACGRSSRSWLLIPWDASCVHPPRYAARTWAFSRRAEDLSSRMMRPVSST